MDMSVDGNTRTPFAIRSGNRIRDLRRNRTWSQAELSKRTGGKLSPSWIANYEQGTRELGILEPEILGKAFHVQPAYLLGVTTLKTALSPLEEELVRNYRALPENDRDAYFKRIEALALAYRTPVADEHLGESWKAPEIDKDPSVPQGTNRNTPSAKKSRVKS